MKINIILEGTDGVGKTSTINELKKDNIICQDRSKDIISKYMMFDVDMEFRARRYYEFLKKSDCIVIFLINNDKEELMKRIYSREKISKFDLQAYEYNILYKDTYLYMKENNMLNNNLFMIDCTGLSLSEQIKEVKKIIKKAEIKFTKQ